MVFAMTTQESCDGYLYFELLDSGEIDEVNQLRDTDWPTVVREGHKTLASPVGKFLTLPGLLSFTVNLMPLGLLRGDIYRLLQLCLIAHQRERNAQKGVQGGLKLWSSASEGKSYLLRCRPGSQSLMKPGPLRNAYSETFE